MSFSSFKDTVIDDIHNKALSTAAKAGKELVELAQPVTPILYGDLRLVCILKLSSKKIQLWLECLV